VRGRRPEGEITDGALVRAARGGDDQAFEALLLRHERRVLRLLRLLGVAAADREDVAQDVFVRVFRHLGSFRQGRPFSAWIYRITVNAAHDHRQRTRRLSGLEDAWEEAHEALGDARGSAEALVDRRDSRLRLEAALARLSERERAVFVLCELEELSSREVGRALGIHAITVRRHLGRARARLQSWILEDPAKKSTAG